MLPYAPWLIGFTLILMRTAGLCMTAPLLGFHAVPGRVRLSIAVAISFAAWSGAGFPVFAAWASLPALLTAAVTESLLGLGTGLCARMALEAASSAGQLAGLSMGLGFSAVLDPMDGVENTITGELIGMMALGALVLAGGHREAIVWLSRSLVDLPAGGGLDIRALAADVVSAALGGISLAVRLAYPVMAAVLVGQVLLGVLGRSAPQLNLASLGFSVTVLAGGAVLYMSAPLMAEIAARHAIGVLAR